jgi:hypothetical protein
MKLTYLAIILIFFSQFSFSQKLPPYRRSSLYMLMVDDTSYQFAKVIKKAYLESKVPEKFNDHNLENRLIKTKVKVVDKSVDKYKQGIAIANFMDENEVAKHAIAKWFNRDKNGAFDMKLVAQRGSYNASEMEVNLAKQSKRGKALIEDAGEELIKNTFVLVSDFEYIPDSLIADKVENIRNNSKKFTNRLGGVGKVAGGLTDAGLNASKLTNGYVVRVTSYLYQLNWTDSVAAVFYSEHWNDNSNLNEQRIVDFDNSTAYTLNYIGKEQAWAKVQALKLSFKSQDELIADATIAAVDAAIAELQKNHEEFRTKTQLFTTDPLSAKIGMKESVSKGDKFVVLEQTETPEGRTKYINKGYIRVDGNKIWDNRVNKDASEAPQIIDRTYFKGTGAKFYPGMLIKQK